MRVNGTTDPDTLDGFIAEMPKAELHVHLVATIQPANAVELARRHDLVHTLATTDPARLADWSVFRAFADFVRVIRAIQNLIRTPDDFALITYPAGAEMTAQTIRYRELTVSPYNHTHIYDKNLSIGEIHPELRRGSPGRPGRLRRRDALGVRRGPNFCFSGPGRVYDPEPAETTLRYALGGC